MEDAAAEHVRLALLRADAEADEEDERVGAASVDGMEASGGGAEKAASPVIADTATPSLAACADSSAESSARRFDPAAADEAGAETSSAADAMGS